LCVCLTRHIAPPNGVGQTEAKTDYKFNERADRGKDRLQKDRLQIQCFRFNESYGTLLGIGNRSI